MSNPRNEQLAKWAKAVIMRMLEHRKGGWIDFNVDDPEAIAEYSAILARAGYDLACHVASHVSEWNGAEMEVGFKTPQEVVNEIPDLAELPEENNTSTD